MYKLLIIGVWTRTDQSTKQCLIWQCQLANSKFNFAIRLTNLNTLAFITNFSNKQKHRRNRGEIICLEHKQYKEFTCSEGLHPKSIYKRKVYTTLLMIFYSDCDWDMFHHHLQPIIIIVRSVVGRPLLNIALSHRPPIALVGARSLQQVIRPSCR